MKKLTFFISIILLFFGCTPDDDAHNPTEINSILLLKVDYLTYQFEGGNEQAVNTFISESDTLPLSIDYKPPGDFGSISLYYKPQDKLLFKGTIVWMGEGAISHPSSFTPATGYPELTTALPFPGNAQFKPLISFSSGLHPDYTRIWNAVSKLRIVSEYRQSGKKAGIMLYTPGVGIGDPAKWDWLVVLGK